MIQENLEKTIRILTLCIDELGKRENRKDTMLFTGMLLAARMILEGAASPRIDW